MISSQCYTAKRIITYQGLEGIFNFVNRPMNYKFYNRLVGKTVPKYKKRGYSANRVSPNAVTSTRGGGG